MSEIVKMKNIVKTFGGVWALRNVDFTLMNNEIHGLVGGNGAGKSTLIKILSGVYPLDKGEIFIEGKKVIIRNPRDAKQLGIETVHQDLALIDLMNVEENLFLGREIKGKLGILHLKKMRDTTTEIMRDMGIKIDPHKSTINLSGGEKQLLALARIRIASPKIIIFDEPTTAIAVPLKKKLEKIITKYNEEGISIIYISHGLKSVWKICDRISILQRGEKIGTFSSNKISISKAASYMV